MGAKAYLRMPAALGISAACLVWLGEATDVDLDLARLSYDASRHEFPLRDAWFARQLGHAYSRLVVIAIAIGFFSCALIDVLRPGAYWHRATGRRIRLVASCAILVPATVGTLKQLSRLHCPWDLALFGGAEPYFRLFDMIPKDILAGKCFPAGHASGGLWLASIMVLWLPKEPRTAWLVGTGMLSIGLVMGVIQQIRGAHFVTHTLWSAWISIAIIYLLYCVLGFVEKPGEVNKEGT